MTVTLKGLNCCRHFELALTVFGGDNNGRLLYVLYDRGLQYYISIGLPN